MTRLPFSRPSIDEETIEGVAQVLRSGWVASGPNVKEFETRLSAYLNGRPVRTLTSATAALEVALQLCGVGPGDEVITPSQTFFAAPKMIVKVGARPVFVDVELSSRNMDLAQTAAAITPRTKALMPTHFAGLPLDMDALYALAAKRGLRVIEDAALAIGSSWKGRRIGSFGDIVVFSFHPNKNMTTIEGGALSLANEYEAKRAEMLRFHGIARLPDGTRDVPEIGGKFNLSDVAARVGIGQLAQLERWNTRRRELAAHYFDCLRTEPACLLPHRGYLDDEAGHSWNMFAPLLPLDSLSWTRKQIRDELEARGIGTGVSYEAVHLASFYRQRFGHKDGEFPNSERIARETLTLPLFPALSEADVERVCGELAAVIGEAAR